MSDIGFFTTLDLIEFLAIVLLALIVPGAAIVRRLLEMRRARWSGQSAEQIWRRLLAARIAEAPFWTILGGGLWLVVRTDSGVPDIFQGLAAICVAGGLAQAFACARQAKRGWAAAQDGRLGRRARRLAGSPHGETAAREEPA